MNVNEIIKDISDNYLGYLKQELPVIKALANKILRVHYDDCHEELIKVHRAYGKVENELELAMVKKQMVVLPLIWEYNKKKDEELLKELKLAIEDIEKDNEVIIEAFKDLRAATNNYTMPSSGCPTYDNTYKKMEKLEEETLAYMELERKLYSIGELL
ncbi:MAG: hemerythrin domain-containing protein [Gudongella sp.]|jgi:regulator of cell morphogenesis and NO signaling|nr:hemerythrin domain-containing protein [Gudongella sp.]